MKTVVLHIGTGKTGTTSIQNYLDDNQDWLRAEADLDFPDIGVERTTHYGERFVAHHDVVAWLDQDKAGKLAALRKRILASDCSLVVLTSEYCFHRLREPAISRFAQTLRGLDVRVLCYLRRQDQMVESAWGQAIRVGQYDRPIEAFLAGHVRERAAEHAHLNYAAMLARWRDAFGRAAIRPRLFERQRFRDGTVIADFCDAIGRPHAYAPGRVRRAGANLSLPRELLEIIRCFNKLDPERTARHRSELIEALRRQRTFADSPLLSLSERLAVLKTYRDVNKAVFEEYFQDPTLSFDTSDLSRRTDDVREPVDTEKLLAELLFAQWQASR